MSITDEQRNQIRQQICSDLISQGVTDPTQLISTAKEIEKFILLEDEEEVTFKMTCLSRDKASLQDAILEFLKQKKTEHLAANSSQPRTSGTGASGGQSHSNQ